jgi:SAM-dependent methyltransferase
MNMPAVGAQVRQFYEVLPFNYEDSPLTQAEYVRRANQIVVYKPLVEILSNGARPCILDAGCGAGWFSNSVAYWYGHDVVGVDFCVKALRQARESASALGIVEKTTYICADLFSLPTTPRRGFDVVNSLGVLHHTPDCAGGVQALASLVARNGYFQVGLYHRHGRAALLDKFAPVRERLATARTREEKEAIEIEGFSVWKRLHRSSTNNVFLWSWYRDQCLHPHETQWELRDVLEWFDACGIEPLRTSLNRFEANPNWTDVVAKEREQRELGYKRIFEEHTYFPGFFVTWGQKR